MNRQFDTVEQLFQFLFVVALNGLGHDFPGQVRGELLDEVAHEPPQESAATETDLGDAGLEQLAGVEHHQVVIELGIDRHFRHDADPQAQAHVSLDHVGVGGGEHHFRREATMTERFVEF